MAILSILYVCILSYVPSVNIIGKCKTLFEAVQGRGGDITHKHTHTHTHTHTQACGLCMMICVYITLDKISSYEN